MKPERCVTTVVVAGSVVLTPLGLASDFRAPERGACATTVADSLVLDTAGEDIRAALVLERWPGPPPEDPSAGLPDGVGSKVAGEPDSRVELDWQISGPDPLISNVIDYGAFPLPCRVGLTAGRWRVRVSCWNRDAAERFSDEWLEADDEFEQVSARPGEVQDEDLFPLGPEVWLVQLWPEAASEPDS